MTVQKLGKIKITATVKKHYEDNGVHTFNLQTTGEIYDKIGKYICEKTSSKLLYTPVKMTDEGENYVKASSMFDIDVMGLPSDYEVSDIGEGTTGKFYLTLTEGKYRGTNYVSAYLRAIDIDNFVEREFNSPFTDEEVLDFDEA